MWEENKEGFEEGMNRNLSRWLFEGAMARMERSNFRLFVITVILIVLLFASNVAWIVYESQFENVSIEQEVDTGAGDAYVAGGDIYGPSETND